MNLETLIGRTLADRYRLDALIGRGAFGAVYRAQHLELEQPVAIKVLLSEGDGGETVIARFRREAQMQARVRHPAIVRLLDFGRDDELIYMVQEFVDGRTLAEVVEADGPLPPHRARRLVEDVLDGLAAAHLQDIVHRDLKPSNLMVTATAQGEEVRILDFGLARIRDGLEDSHILTRSGQILGTPAFMAPEQIEQGTLGPATDLYAVGAIYYFLLTGQRPFQGSLRAVLTAHLIRPVPLLPSHLPSELNTVVARAMSKAPEDRYPGADAMRAALRWVGTMPGMEAFSLAAVQAAIPQPPPLPDETTSEAKADEGVEAALAEGVEAVGQTTISETAGELLDGPRTLQSLGPDPALDSLRPPHTAMALAPRDGGGDRRPWLWGLVALALVVGAGVWALPGRSPRSAGHALPADAGAPDDGPTAHDGQVPTDGGMDGEARDAAGPPPDDAGPGPPPKRRGPPRRTIKTPRRAPGSTAPRHPEVKEPARDPEIELRLARLRFDEAVQQCRCDEASELLGDARALAAGLGGPTPRSLDDWAAHHDKWCQILVARCGESR